MKNFTNFLRKFGVLLICCGFGFSLQAQQVTFIGAPFSGGGNDDDFTGVNFQTVADGASAPTVEWRVYQTNGAPGDGQTTICRVIVRGMEATADPTSLTAAAPTCTVNGAYQDDQGNDDRYSADLSTCALADGRYSVEVQCDIAGGDYDNSTGGTTALASWNYSSTPPYYTGTAGACGPIDPLDNIDQEGANPQLEYFNVGDADVYRTMVVLNGLFLDMGKFQPGNPDLPANLNDLQTLYDPGCVGVASFPMTSFCPGDMLTLGGAETNIMKNTTCGTADVTGNRLYYRVFPAGNPSGAFVSVPIAFNDDCPAADISTYPTGGSCQNSQGQLQQRWQTTNAGIDLLALAPTSGDYTVEFYTETDITRCDGSTDTVTEGTYTTGFTVSDSTAAACGCGANNGALSGN